MIRVLVVEDSPTARSLLVQILKSDSEIQVVGEADNGVEGVELARKLRPDVVTMDVHMPRMNGLEATKEIMITAPTPIVIISSSYAMHEVEMSMNALRAGALAVLPKPAGPAMAGFEEASQQLIAQIKAMAQVKVVRHWRPAKLAQRSKEQESAADPARVRVVAIATSTGGPAALHAILAGLPRDFAVPILVVQHISSGFAKGLADWLNKAGNLRVKLAEDGETLQGGTAYLAPDDRHLGVSSRGTVAFSAAPPIGGFRPSATHLFDSVAGVYGASAIGVILTGMGEDGVAGLQTLRQTGGRVIAQDEKTSVVFGMPSAAITAGLADMVLPLENIASQLIELV
jgi:two-component system chemotaxis response regulator CheB